MTHTARRKQESRCILEWNQKRNSEPEGDEISGKTPTDQLIFQKNHVSTFKKACTSLKEMDGLIN